MKEDQGIVAQRLEEAKADLAEHKRDNEKL